METFEHVRAVLVEHFGRAPDAISLDATLSGDLMLDGLDVMDLLGVLERVYGLTARPETARPPHRLADLVDQLVVVETAAA